MIGFKALAKAALGGVVAIMVPGLLLVSVIGLQFVLFIQTKTINHFSGYMCVKITYNNILEIFIGFKIKIRFYANITVVRYSFYHPS